MIEIDEFDHYIGRNKEDYSKSHQALYLCISEILRNQKLSILEIGSGIGYGLKKLYESNCIGEYIGVEPSRKCIDHLNSIIISLKRMFYQYNWLEIPNNIFDNKKFDVTLCIEVIEHTNPNKYLDFLTKIYKCTKNSFFFSTPDANIEKSGGTLNKEQCFKLLIESGFKNISLLEFQKPHLLYICNV